MNVREREISEEISYQLPTSKSSKLAIILRTQSPLQAFRFLFGLSDTQVSAPQSEQVYQREGM